MPLRCAPPFLEERSDLQFAHDANSRPLDFCRKQRPFVCALVSGHAGECITPLFGRTVDQGHVTRMHYPGCVLERDHGGKCELPPLPNGPGPRRHEPFAAEVGPTAPTVTHENGGMESATPFAMHLIPPRALLELGRAMEAGRQKGYPPDNWKLIPASQHLNHALVHIAAHLDGDTSDAHLAHAACRLMFAIECEPQGARGNYPGILES